MISLRVLHPCGFETRCIFTRDRCRSPVTTVGWVGVGWGGDGVITFLAHVHIFDAMPVFYRATEIMVGWGGDGMITFLAHVHIFDAMPVFLSCYGMG